MYPESQPTRNVEVAVGACAVMTVLSQVSTHGLLEIHRPQIGASPLTRRSHLHLFRLPHQGRGVMGGRLYGYERLFEMIRV